MLNLKLEATGKQIADFREKNSPVARDNYSHFVGGLMEGNGTNRV